MQLKVVNDFYCRFKMFNNFYIASKTIQFHFEDAFNRGTIHAMSFILDLEEMIAAMAELPEEEQAR